MALSLPVFDSEKYTHGILPFCRESMSIHLLIVMFSLVSVAISIQTCGAPNRSGLIELVGNVVDLGYNLQKPIETQGGDIMLILPVNQTSP
ncbi:unnamed protein product [Musa textilis]